MGFLAGLLRISSAGWPNGKALDYESRDCRFDPCVGHYFFFFSIPGYLSGYLARVFFQGMLIDMLGMTGMETIMSVRCV